jgi:hypothetical protein
MFLRPHRETTLSRWLGQTTTRDTETYSFAKSTDGGKTLKTLMISAPNKGNTIDQNTETSWWTIKTGTLMPVFIASNDNGDAFAKAITLNSTG